MEDHERKTRLVRSRASHKGVATRYTNKAAQILAVPSAQLTVAQRSESFGLRTALESKRSLIADLGKEIEMLIEDDDASEAEVAESSENLDAITQTILLITRLLTEADQPMAIVNQAPQAMQDERRQTRQGLQLPKMNIPVFSGEYLQWNSFWDLFNASVHTNETLTDAQRLQYFKASLKGDAAKIISHLTITDANYAGARNALQTRYANLRLIVRSHIRAMLEVPVMKGETAQEMRNLLETFREQMQALETFGVPVRQWDAILVYHISEKLDSESRKAWELAHAGNDLQTIQQMTDFLSERCRALESSSAKLKSVLPAETKTVNSANKGSNARRGYGHNQSGPERGQAYGASVTETNICQICRGNHKVQNCQEFTSLDVAARVDLVKQKKLCFNCLRSSHMINQCPSKSVCRTCRGKHHSLIHRERLSNERAHVAMAQSSEADNSNQSAIVSNEIAQSNLGINGNSQVILATALVSIEKPGSHEQIKCRAFLDPGAQLSCITEQCVQTLGLAKERSSMQIFGIGASGSTLSKYKVSFNLLGDDRVIPVEAFVLD